MSRLFEKKSQDYILDNCYDLVIIGSGISGIMCALNISQEMKVLIISKSDIKRSNSSLAQGGIATSIGDKNKISHIEDTLEAGAYMNDRNIVETMVNYSDKIVEKLLEYGVDFDRDDNGELLFTREGGHSERRILHCKDQTGDKIMQSLISNVIERRNIKILESCFAVDFIIHEDRVCGVSMIDSSGNLLNAFSNTLVLASGGIGSVFAETTNTSTSTGDGIAMSIRAGVNLADMEFVQFHPTAFDINIEDGFLISEALRGEGAKLVNSEGIEFMENVHRLKELAPRDIVSQAIFRELQCDRKVYLDIRHKSKQYIQKRFPKIFDHCLSYNIDMSKDLIPIRPVQHYFMGGVKVDSCGKSSLGGLYAVGECTNTGAHGANRLASNSLLESAAFGLIVSREINENTKKKNSYGNFDSLVSIITKQMNNKSVSIMSDLEIEKIRMYKRNIQRIMSTYVSIEKNKEGLSIAHKKLEKIQEKFEKIQSKDIIYYEAINILAVAMEIVTFSLKRDKSVGSHLIKDWSLL